MSEQTTTGTSSQTQALTYEQARDELVAVVAQLESGGVPLEQSLALWERGEALAARTEPQTEPPVRAPD